MPLDQTQRDNAIEACLEAIRVHFVDPLNPPEDDKKLNLAYRAFASLLKADFPAAADLAEAAAYAQTFALSSVIYHAYGMDRDAWFAELTTDLKRIYWQLEMLLSLADKCPQQPQS
jgi:hypothetical protein